MRLSKVSNVFSYSTTLQVSFRNVRGLGITFRILQLLLLIYLFGYVILWRKSYQSSSALVSSNRIFVAGVAKRENSSFTPRQNEKTSDIFINMTSENMDSYMSYENRLLDGYDVMPLSSYSTNDNSFFIATTSLVTPNQTIGTCAENPAFISSRCKLDSDCMRKSSFANQTKVFTGKCVPSFKQNIKTCEVFAWCPRPDESPKSKTSHTVNYRGIENLRVTIDNFISFPDLGPEYSQGNSYIFGDIKYYMNCLYNEETDKACPKFKVYQMLEQAGKSYSSMFKTGTMIRILITWKCDFDFTKICPPPEYLFQAMEQKEHATIFVQPLNHEDGRRTFTIHTGIKFYVEVVGHGYKFSLVRLLSTIGTGAGLFSVVKTICDFLLGRVFRKSNTCEVIQSEEGYHLLGIPKQSEKQVSETHELLPEGENDQKTYVDT